MFGGPFLGVLVFIVIAIGLGWGLISLFQGMVDHTAQDISQGEFDHGFDPDVAYVLQRDLVLGYLADGRIVLLPGREDLPPGTPGKRSAVSIDELRNSPADHPEHIGIVTASTAVRFIEVIDDRDNQQTRVLVMTRLLNGPYARKTPVLGMHLESVDSESEGTRYVPRADLFVRVEVETGEVQSQTPTDESP